MRAQKPSILVIDDESGILDTLRILLKNSGFTPDTAQGGRAGLDAMRSSPPDIVLADIRMPQVTGIDILAAARDQDPEMPVILMTAQASLQTAIQAQLKREIRKRERSKSIKPIGNARNFIDVLQLAEQVAPTESTVLILGESGTGKEVVARFIHELSERTEGPFFSINCGALPESLLESELFGHMKGAFTGAVRDKQGLFAAARGGTFFLDEIAEMTPSTQVKLLRVLQEREALPVGGTEPVPVDVRVIAATNRDLDDEMRRGTFRQDLYYRLNVISLHLPPLRARREDIPVLAEGLLQRMAEDRMQPVKHLADDALQAIMAYDWPGNVRELENALEHAALLAADSNITAGHLPERATARKAQPLVADRPPDNPTLEAVERAYILWVLNAEGGNKTRAAEVLGIDPSTLYRKLARYESESA
jgi:two-component system response regulator HydG